MPCRLHRLVDPLHDPAQLTVERLDLAADGGQLIAVGRRGGQGGQGRQAGVGGQRGERQPLGRAALHLQRQAGDVGRGAGEVVALLAAGGQGQRQRGGAQQVGRGLHGRSPQERGRGWSRVALIDLNTGAGAGLRGASAPLRLPGSRAPARNPAVLPGLTVLPRMGHTRRSIQRGWDQFPVRAPAPSATGTDAGRAGISPLEGQGRDERDRLPSEAGALRPAVREGRLRLRLRGRHEGARLPRHRGEGAPGAGQPRAPRRGRGREEHRRRRRHPACRCRTPSCASAAREARHRAARRRPVRRRHGLPAAGRRAGRAACERIVEETIRAEGQRLLGWRDVPTDAASLGAIGAGSRSRSSARSSSGAASGLADDLAFERKLYVIRRLVEKKVSRSRHPGPHATSTSPSLSCKTIVYKGMLNAAQLRDVLPGPAATPRVTSALAHGPLALLAPTPSRPGRAPTRTATSAHNGEINTLRGNINWMHARQSHAAVRRSSATTCRRSSPSIDTGRLRLGDVRQRAGAAHAGGPRAAARDDDDGARSPGAATSR